MRVWRLALSSRAEILDGMDRAVTGGRWTSPGQPVIYAAELPGLAMLETLAAPVPTHSPEACRRLLLDVPQGRALAVGSRWLPDGWAEDVACTRSIGDRWLSAKLSLLLRVPSVFARGECLVLINPSHPDHQAVRILDMVSFGFDLWLDAA